MCTVPNRMRSKKTVTVKAAVGENVVIRLASVMAVISLILKGISQLDLVLPPIQRMLIIMI